VRRALGGGLLLAALGCSPAAPPPVDPEVARREYADLQQRARDDLQAWSAAGGRVADPRPRWALDLERFARRHRGTAEAADALIAALDLWSATRDVEAFFGAYDLMLAIAPDAPGLQSVFEQVSLMRMVEAGGLSIAHAVDPEAKKRAYRIAAPRIAADIERALKATRNPETIAAAHYALGRTWHQIEVDLRRALEHFKIVAERHPGWTHAESARMYVREIEDLAVGKAAPDFSATALDGRSVSLSSLRGSVVLVDFWATWCQPCLDELPALKRTYRRYRSRGFEILGVSVDDDRDAVREFVEAHGVTWPTVARGEGMLDPLARQYGVRAIPTSFLVGADGRILARSLSGSEVTSAVRRALEGV
jgi:peroxiredoxin